MKAIQTETPMLMTPDEAVGITVNQYLFASRQSSTDLSVMLGVSRSSAHRKLRGIIGWSLTELLAVATYFNIQITDLTPTPDGMGGWIPAPFVPGKAKAPAAKATEANVVVAGTGFEPATSGL